MTPKARHNTGLPATPEELTRLIIQHVNTALEERDANQNDGQKHECGTPRQDLGGTQIGNPSGKIMIGKFWLFTCYDLIGTYS